MGARIIPNELTDYGGFFSGEDAYYFLFAEDNTEENDDKEVFRVVKYSKDWKRLGAAAITGVAGFVTAILAVVKTRKEKKEGKDA